MTWALRALALLSSVIEKKKRAVELHIAHPDGSVSVTHHASSEDAHATLLAHLAANGGHGHAVITPPGNPFNHDARLVAVHHPGMVAHARAAQHRGPDGKFARAAKARLQKTAYQGIPIHLDRPKGFVQEGADASGKPWRRVYRYDYGFIPKTAGGDDEDTDVFLGPNADAPQSYWAMQVDDAGDFDEFKVFLGFSTLALARGCYNMHIPPRFCAGFFAVPVSAMKSLMGLHPSPVIQGLIKMKNLLVRKTDVSFDTLQSAVAAALSDAYPSSGDGCSPSSVWPVELFDNAVVFSKDGVLMKDGYTFANGKATLAGSPVAVMRTYVPVGQTSAAAGAGGEVTMNQAKNTKTTKATPDQGQGAGDIIGLAAERLSAVAQTVGSGDGTITPEIASELDAVGSLIQVAQDLYSGSAPQAPDSADDLTNPDDPGEQQEDGGGEMQMADVAGAGKSASGAKAATVPAGMRLVMMTPEQFVAHTAKALAELKKETDPQIAMLKQMRLEAITAAGTMLLAKSDGEPIPVTIIDDAEAPTTETRQVADVLASQTSNGAAVSPTPPAPALAPMPEPTGKSAGTNPRLTKAMGSIVALRDRMTGKVTKNEPASAGAGSALATADVTAGGEFTAEYIDTLPDGSFLFVEDGAPQTKGRTSKNHRHFPVRDKSGALSKVMLEKALKDLESFAAPASLKNTIKSRASQLVTFAKAEEESRVQAKTRGDQGWVPDLAPPNPRAPKLPNTLETYGHDNLTGKIAERGGK